MNLTYIPLESYKARYTELLSCPGGWAEAAFAARFTKVVPIRPKSKEEDLVITNGRVLDSRNRPKWALKQMGILADMPYSDMGKIYFDDFFTPGLEALPYFGAKFQAYAFCWAQTFDMYDFTFPMSNWMRPYEVMAYGIYNKVFVACEELKDLITACSSEMGARTHVVGLPFNSKNVATLRDPAYECPEYDVVFTSRLDEEKQPDFFLDLVRTTGVKAAICTGHSELRGDAIAVQKAKSMAEHGKLDIHLNMTKGQYYAVLAKSHVQFNCALQDWVSYTLLEALTYGCVPLYPNFRSFPAALDYAEGNLYRPFDLDDAAAKLQALLDQRRQFNFADQILVTHDSTLSRIADMMFKD